MSKEKIRVAIYTRVSTQEQAEEGYSLDSQQRILSDYCAAKRYELYKIYADEGISAKDIKHRPSFLSMLAEAKEGNFKKIVVWRLDRFSRNIADTIVSCDTLDKLGVALESFTECFDSQTPSGRMTRNIISSVAQYQREIISENVYMGQLERAKQGKRTCSQVLGYDLYGKDSLIINTAEAEYVNFVHDQYLIRKSITEVTELARENGYRGKRGKIPTPQSIYVILTRPIYAGYNLYDGCIYKGNYTPIRTPHQFNKVQRIILRQGKVIGQPRKHPLFIIPE